MRRSTPLSALWVYFGYSTLSLTAATVEFSSGSGTDVILFETELGAELVGASMFAGTFASQPALGSLTFEDVLADFEEFDVLGDVPPTTSNSFGAFGNSSFKGSVGTTFASAKIYLLVVDDPVIANATEFAVFSSTDPTWIFPPNDIVPDASSITLYGTVNQYFAGSADTITNPGGISGTFDSIQLESTTTSGVEPSQTTFVVDAGFPGVQFDFPKAQDGLVNYRLEKSDTLQPLSWTTVLSTPTFESEDETTQVIQILDTVPLASQTKNYYRVVYSTP